MIRLSTEYPSQPRKYIEIIYQIGHAMPEDNFSNSIGSILFQLFILGIKCINAPTFIEMQKATP